MQYNEEHGIIPKTIKKDIYEEIRATLVEETKEEYKLESDKDLEDIISELTDTMLEHAQKMEFEKAAEIRDKIKELEALRK